MALISAELFEHPEILEIMETYEHTIGPTNLVNESRTFQQRHEMMETWNSHYYEYCVGGKTGYTDEAGNTLITLADNGKMRLICVEMATRGQHIYDDTRSLLDYAFAGFSRQEAKSSILESAEEDVHATITEKGPVYVDLPVGIPQEELEFETGEENGVSMLYLTWQGQTVGKVAADVDEKAAQRAAGDGKKPGAVTSIRKILEESIWIVIGAAAVLILIAVILVFVIRRRKRSSFLRLSRRKQRRQESQRRRRMKRAARRSRRRGRKRW